MVRSFLAATARAYEWAAAHPAEAAELFLTAVAAEHAAQPALPQPLDPEVVKESQVGSMGLGPWAAGWARECGWRREWGRRRISRTGPPAMVGV